jgi:hypothetical protein
MDLRQHLPAPPAGYERIIVGGKILLVQVATQVIHDVLMDVVLNQCHETHGRNRPMPAADHAQAQMGD